MSYFLRNLIARHRVGGARAETNHVVEPRLKSRFEADSNTGSSLSQHVSGIGPIVTSVGEELSPDQHIRPDLRSSNRKENSVPGHLIVESGNQIATLTEASEQESMAPETPLDMTQSKRKHAIDARTERTRIAEPKSSQRLSVSKDLNHRMQTILHRLGHQQSQHAENQTSTEPEQYPALKKPVNNAIAGTAQRTLMPETILDIKPTGRIGKQSINNRSEQQESRQSGLLQTPNWLTEMQFDLNNRWREINPRTEPEPVVNVTIGRVEVRAVQSPSAKQPERRNKPGGIMSLDDYLKQRTRGQA